MSVAIKIESVSKLYRLGTVGTGTIAHDLNRWWHLVRGKEDPYAKVGQVNDRTQSSTKNQEQGTKNGAAAEYVWALRDINLEVQQGEILGIIGRNGAGKSTLLKLLSRVTAPTQGTIKTKGRIASLLEVGTGFHPELTGRENIYMNGAILGMRRHEITRQLDEIVEFSGCAKYLDTPVKRYSSGMTVRLGFAVAAHLQCEILIVDEVLAVGDAEFQSKCLGKMHDVAKAGRAILFVSHNMGAVAELCTSAALLSDGTVKHTGTVDSCIEVYLRRHSAFCPTSVSLSRKDQKFWLRTARVINSQGAETGVFSVNEPIVIEFTYETSVSCPIVEIGFRVASTRGARLFTSKVAISGSVGCQFLGSAWATIPPHFLVPGEYLLTVAAHIPDVEILNLAEDALQFTIEETGSALSRYKPSEYGVVFANCEWKVRQGE